MPIFFQHTINEFTRLGIWKIEETEEFFKGNVPQHRDVTHPHKRLQHLAGRFLLQFLFPDFPYELIRIADTRKPYLPNEQYHFSISHCGDYAAAIVSKNSRVGIDIEIPVPKIEKVKNKFLNEEEMKIFHISKKESTPQQLTPNTGHLTPSTQHPTPKIGQRPSAIDHPKDPSPLRQAQGSGSPNTQHLTSNTSLLTLLWSAKESIYKWYGDGGVDFSEHINLLKQHESTETIDCFFYKTQKELLVHYHFFEHLVLAWVVD